MSIPFSSFLLLWSLIGVSIATTLSFKLGSLLIFSVVLLVWFLLSKKRLPLLIISLLAGAGYTTTWRLAHRAEVDFQHKSTFKARIVDLPDVRAEQTYLTIQPLSGIAPAYFSKIHFPFLIRLSVLPNPRWQYGDSIEVKGRLEKPVSLDGFDYPLYLERYGISATMRQAQVKKISQDSASPSLYTFLYSLKNKWEEGIQKALPEPEASFLAGILLGSKRAIPEDLQLALQKTGTSHLIAISGANITILVMILIKLLPPLKPFSKVIYTLLLCVFISLLTGASASVLRGAIIATVSSYLRARSRLPPPFSILVTSMALLCLWNPLLIRDAGFQLSFAAFAGLMYISPLLSKGWSKLPLFFQRAPPIVKESIVQTTAASLGTFPFSLYLFGKASLIGLFANPFVLWLIPIVSSLGMILILVSSFKFLVFFIRLPLWLLLHTILFIIGKFAFLQTGIIHWQLSPFNLVVWLSFFLIFYLWLEYSRAKPSSLQQIHSPLL